MHRIPGSRVGCDRFNMMLELNNISNMFFFFLLWNVCRYDPDDTVVTRFLVLGMAVMAASLLLFEAA